MEGISRGAAGGDGCKEVGWSFPAPDSPGQKVEQVHHLQQTEEESEEEQSGGQRTTPGMGVSVQCSKTDSFF